MYVFVWVSSEKQQTESNLGLFGEGPGGLEDEGVEDEEGAERDPVVADDEAGVEHRILSKETKNIT